MPYGQGRMLGDTIDPRLSAVDYSPYVNAAAINAQSISDLGGQIAGAINQYADIKKQNSEIAAFKKTTENQIDSAINLFGDKIPQLSDQLNKQKALLNDPNISLYEQGMIAKNLSNNINSTLNMFMDSYTMNTPKESYSVAPPQSQKPAQQMGGFVIP